MLGIDGSNDLGKAPNDTIAFIPEPPLLFTRRSKENKETSELL